jgi:hypothetical protein
MSFWSVLGGVAKRLLPFILTTGLEAFRKKNPKYGWLVDAVSNRLTHMELNPEFASLTQQAKINLVSRGVLDTWPGTDPEMAKHIVRLAVIDRQRKKS